jgi:LysM repeat protein
MKVVMGNSCAKGCFFYLIVLVAVVAVTALGVGSLKGRFGAKGVQNAPASVSSQVPHQSQAAQGNLLKLGGGVPGGGEPSTPVVAAPTPQTAPQVFTPVPSQGGTIVGEASVPFYIVQPGDTLWDIAWRFGTNIETLKALNNLQTETIYPGQLIYLPDGTQSPDSQLVVPSGQVQQLPAADTTGVPTVIIPEMPNTGIIKRP